MTRKVVGFAIVALVCAAGSALCFAGIRPPSTRPAVVSGGDTGIAPTLTPLWSARRIPALLVDAAERAARARADTTLTRHLTSIVAPVDACVAVHGPSGSLASVNVDLPLAPASTFKLLTATAAIDRFGPDHRFTTRVLRDPSGDLVVVGGGDPLLATAPYIAAQHAQPRFRDAPYTALSALADAVVAAGVRTVTGALVVDDHVHDSLRFLPAWKRIYAEEGDIGSLGGLTVDGGFTDPNGETPSADPAITTGQRLAALLAARGVTIAHGVQRGLGAASDREVAHVDSRPVSSIVGEMLTSSDNYTAEELVRDLAVGGAGAAAATTGAGTAVVERVLGRLGVSTAGLIMHDASGLAPADRVTCATMLQLIELARQPRFAAVDAGLAVAAHSGTLAERFFGSPLAGKLHAKTGSISGVVGLVGFVDRPDQLRFAFLANGNFSTAGGETLQDEVAEAVASTPRVQAPSGLVPRP